MKAVHEAPDMSDCRAGLVYPLLSTGPPLLHSYTNSTIQQLVVLRSGPETMFFALPENSGDGITFHNANQQLRYHQCQLRYHHSCTLLRTRFTSQS